MITSLSEKKILSILLIIFALEFFFSLCYGKYEISGREVIDFLLQKEIDTKKALILKEIRIPRILMASFCGLTLGIIGVYLQGVMRNPLISGDILGMASGATFGSLVSMLWFEGILFRVGFSCFFGMISLGLVLLLSNGMKRKNEDRIFLILSGLMVSAFFSSGIGLLKFIADPQDKLPSMIYWLMGTFSNIDIEGYKKIMILEIGILYFLYKIRYQLNLFSLQKKELKIKGYPYERNRNLIFLMSGIALSMMIAMTGRISFVGLLIPNLSRPIIGVDHRILVPFSGMLGAIYVLFMDNMARGFETDMPISLFTSIFGAPIFILIIVKRIREKGRFI